MTIAARKRPDRNARREHRRPQRAAARPVATRARAAGTDEFRQYWVIGGEFADARFERLVNGASVLGPYADYGTALAAWRRIAVETRSQCNTRYTITANSVGTDGDAAEMVDVTPVDMLADGVSRR